MSSEEQVHIPGFSRLLIQNSDSPAYPPIHDYSGCYISKDRNFIIVPDNKEEKMYQLLPITVQAAKELYKFITKMCGPLHDVVAYYNRHFKQELV